MLPQQYCLRWKYHHSNLQTMFSQLLERQAFCDVTLACEGRTIKAHKVVLSACSTYFDTILSQYEEKDPILIMKDVKFVDIKCLVEFMYKGEINVDHCHLATLLKTAEDLRIKGLAEVSWRDDESCNESGLNGIQSVLPQVSTVMDTGSDQEPPNKRKRGRPPIDDYDQPQGGYSASKMGSLSGSNDPYQPEVVIPDDDVADWDDDQQHSTNESVADENDIGNKANTDNEQYGKENGSDYTNANEQGDSQNPTSSVPANTSTSTPTTPSGNNQTSNLSVLEAQWPDVIKMNDYLNTGRRQQFWEEPFTRRVMEAIKSKELEMKCAAELLGVSYGTLYGRYRDAYGCLKHPYRVRDFWNESGQSDILGKLQRKEITLFRAAEQLNVTPQTLSNYLITLNGGDLDASTSYSNDVSRDGDDSDDNSDSNHILPDSPSPLVSIKPRDTSSLTQSVLQNHPDITIIKKEKVPMKDTTVTTVPTISSKPSNHSDDSSSSHYEGE